VNGCLLPSLQRRKLSGWVPGARRSTPNSFGMRQQGQKLRTCEVALSPSRGGKSFHAGSQGHAVQLQLLYLHGSKVKSLARVRLPIPLPRRQKLSCWVPGARRSTPHSFAYAAARPKAWHMRGCLCPFRGGVSFQGGPQKHAVQLQLLCVCGSQVWTIVVPKCSHQAVP
jgi:hypothetical protein